MNRKKQKPPGSNSQAAFLLCPVCNKEFVKEHNRQVNCSKSCSRRASRSAYQKRLREKKGKLPLTPKGAKEKRCKKCTETKPRADFSSRPAGLVCNVCLVRERAERRIKNPEKARASSRKWKENNKEWSNNNKDKKKESARKWREKNKDKIKQKRVEIQNNWLKNNKSYAKEWRDNNKDKIKEYQDKWNTNNPEYRAAWRSKYKERIAKFKIDNKEKFKEYSRRRRLNMRLVGGSHTPEEWEALKDKYNFLCLCCGKHEGAVELTRDHVIPVVKGGSDNIDNIQPLCRSCNAKKNTKTIDYRTKP